MSRYAQQISTPVPPQSLHQPICDYLYREGFRETNYKGTTVWKKGVGLLTAPQYVSISYGPTFVQLEAFIRFALLPGVYIGEMGLDGALMIIPKQLLKQRVQAIEGYIYSLWQNNSAQAVPQQQ